MTAAAKSALTRERTTWRAASKRGDSRRNDRDYRCRSKNLRGHYPLRQNGAERARTVAI